MRSSNPDAKPEPLEAGPDAIRLAANALKGRRWDAALDHLDAAGEQQDPGLKTRAHAFRAQALEGLGRLDEAERAAALAVQSAKREPGQPGLVAVRGLHAAILAQVGAREVAKKALEADRALLDQADAALATEPNASAVLVRRANALADAGRPDEARASATLAWELAREPREHVLAALTISRCGSAEAWIKKAHEVADRSDDQNLLTAVAKAAKMAGVALDVLPRQ